MKAVTSLFLFIALLTLAYSQTFPRYETIFEAAKEGDLGDVKLHLQRGAPIEMKRDSGLTPIAVASAFGFADIVEYLASKGARLDNADDQGRLPIHWAIDLSRNIRVVGILLKYDSPKEVPTSLGFSPLNYAVNNEDESMTEFLLKMGANPNSPLSRMPPLFTAIDKQNVRICTLLLEAGADPNSPRPGGTMTPYEFAMKTGNFRIISLFAKHSSK